MGAGGSWNRDWDNGALARTVSEQGFAATAEAQPSSSIGNLGWQFYGGYKFSDFLAIEGGYVHFIDSHGYASVTGDLAITELFLREQTNTWKLGGVMAFPVWGDVRIVGKLGVNFWESNTKAFNITPPDAIAVGSPEGLGETVFEREKRGTDLYYGVGVDWALAENFSLRLELERFKVAGDNMDLLTGGFNFGF
jgi:hypothetical protein